MAHAALWGQCENRSPGAAGRGRLVEKGGLQGDRVDGSGGRCGWVVGWRLAVVVAWPGLGWGDLSGSA